MSVLKHRWILDHKSRSICFSCGIRETFWLQMIAKEPLDKWTCKAIKERRKAKQL